MTSKPFTISGAIRLVGAESAADSIGIVVFSSRKRNNVVFTAREAKNKRIRSFTAIDVPEPYDLLISETHYRYHFLLDEKCAAIGDKMVLCYLHEKTAYFFDSTVFLRSDASEFESILMTANSYSAYALRSYLLPSYAQKVNDLLRLRGGLDNTWAQAEMTFHQRSNQYWDIVERREQDKSAEVEVLLGGRLDPQVLLRWLKRHPFGYLNDQETWVYVWTRATDFGYETAVLAAMGKDFLIDTGPLCKESFGVAARLRGILSRSDWNEVYNSMMQALSDSKEILTEMTYVEVEAAVRLMNLFTFEIFAAKGRGIDTVYSIDTILRSWRTSASRGSRRLADGLMKDWVASQIKFFLDVDRVWPSRAPAVLSGVHQAILTGQYEAIGGFLKADLMAFAYQEVWAGLQERKLEKQSEK